MKRTLLSAVVLTAAFTANAQRDSTHMDDVVVTATKSPKKLSETGKVLTVISREQLDRSAGKDVAQLLNEQTGIVVNGATSNPSKDKSIFIRGAKSDYTLVLIDGIPVYDPAGTGASFDLRSIPIDNIERIEILKGSQSTLYGSDAIAGVINIITRKRGDKPIGAFATGSYGSFNTFKGNAGINGSTAIVDYNVAYTYQHTDGISEAKDPTGNNNFGKNGYTQNAILANIGIKVTHNWKLMPFLRYSHYSSALDYGAFLDDKDYTYKNKSLQTGLRSELQVGKSTFTLNYSYNNVKRSDYNDSGYVNPAAFDKFSKGSYQGRDHFVELVYATQLAKNLQLVAGVDYRNSNTGQDYLSISSFGPYATSLNKDSAKQHQENGYVSLSYGGKIFHIEAGTRYNHHSTYGTKWTYNFNPFVFIDKQVKVFANISSAFKTPTLYQLYAPTYGNKSLTPESAVTYEGGVQYFSKDQKFNIRGVIFKRDVKNVIAFTNSYVNQDKQNDWGIEIEPTFKISDDVQLILKYAHVKGKLTTKNNGKDSSSNILLRRPDDTYSMTVNYRATKKLFLSAGIQSIGKRVDMDFGTYPTSLVNLPAYTLWNAYAEYRFSKQFKAFADFKNITNTDYVEVYGYSTQPASLQVGVSVNF